LARHSLQRAVVERFPRLAASEVVPRYPALIPVPRVSSSQQARTDPEDHR
jgi:hypothetical protein